jgi:uncharacterized protein
MQSEGISAEKAQPAITPDACLIAPDVRAEGITTEPAPLMPRALPVQPGERVAGVDVLRGVALMGILAMNIALFAWPDPVYDSPRAGGNTSTLDLVVWTFNHVVFDEKMMTIFSMLFGAGLVLMTGRSDARGASLLGVYYRRVSWLLLIGLLHAYLLWHGDILVLYAECGYLLYLFRRKSPRTLIIVGILCVMIPVALAAGLSVIVRMSEEDFWNVQGTPREVLKGIAEFVDENFLHEPGDTPEKFAQAIEAYRGPYPGIVRQRLPFLIGEQTFVFLFVTLWMVGGRMLVGMGLMKLDVFSGRRSRGFYLWMIKLGYGIGLPMVAYDCWLRVSNDFEGARQLEAKWIFGYLSALAIAMGHVGVVMLLFQNGAIPWLTRRLAAAGRMALSNYLMQSLICTTLFYGYGFGLFASLNRLELAGVVVAVWVFQLTTSIIWLRYFRYGPAEWLWRSLTYLKPQPLLALADGGTITVPKSAPASAPIEETAIMSANHDAPEHVGPVDSEQPSPPASGG